MSEKLGQTRWLVLASVIGLLAAAATGAADWPQFRGPQRAGTVDEPGLLQAWGAGEPAVVWRRAIGSGYSAVTVVGDRLYTMDADASQEHVLCLDAVTGKTRWQVDAGDFVQAELGDGGPRSTPTVVDDVVYTTTSQATLLALDAGDGRLIWQRDLTEFGPTPRFGYATSALVDDRVVIVEVGDKDRTPGVVALDRATGELVWSGLEGPAGYSSAIATEIGGVRQYIFFRRAGQEAVGLSTDGEILWRFATPDALAAIVMPIHVPPDRVFLSTSDDSFGGHMIRILPGTDGFTAEELWSERLMRNHFNTSVLVDGYLYGFDNGTLRCLDAATGEKRWGKRGFGKGSVVAAGDLLYVLSDAGLVALVRATAEGFEELGRRQVMEGRSWTAPSLAHGRLYLRDFDEIISLAIGDTAAAAAEGTP
jgi:outer membrane protein assembly factor BamB